MVKRVGNREVMAGGVGGEWSYHVKEIGGEGSGDEGREGGGGGVGECGAH